MVTPSKGVGSRAPRNRRKLRVWTIKNDTFYQAIIDTGKGIGQVSKEIGISERGLQRYIYQGVRPEGINIKRIRQYFGRKIDELFPARD
jgi:hypothetical protein